MLQGARLGAGGAVGLLSPRALYIHVPFCPQVCPYCDFHKMRRTDGLVERYLSRLEDEAAALALCLPGRLDSVYIGGGTPSHLTDDELERILGAIGRHWGSPHVEFTIEADPLTFDRERLARFADWGVSRLSVGVQSTSDAVLATLGRLHSGAQGLAALHTALDSGLEVSADVLIGVPGQDAGADLVAVAETGVPHVSVYSLTVERYTPFHFRGVRVDPDQDARDFAAAVAILHRYGLSRYEVSNYAKSGHEAWHNSVYWRGDPFLALGPSAAAFLPACSSVSWLLFQSRREPIVAGQARPGTLLWTGAESEPTLPLAPALADHTLMGWRVTQPGMRPWLAGAAPEIVPVSPERYLEDLAMTALRTREGLDLVTAAARSGIDMLERHADTVAMLRERNLIRLEAGRMVATEAGLWQLNQVAAAFLPPVLEPA